MGENYFFIKGVKFTEIISDDEQFLESNFNDYKNKPFDIEKLISQIAKFKNKNRKFVIKLSSNIMNAETLVERFKLLPNDMQLFVFDYIEFLLSRCSKTSTISQPQTTDNEISAEIKLLLDERIAEYEENPQNVVTWDDVKEKFNKKHGYAI